MSNQRPNTSREFVKRTSDITTAAFGADGVCDACRWHDEKRNIDWTQREKQLRDLLDRHRSADGSYDVIVPASGGKDSIYVAHLLKYRYNMNPLTVTWAPHLYTDVGWRNLQALIKAGFDNVLVSPNAKVHAVLTRLAFENLVNPFQPFIIGQKNVAPRAALQYGVKLIMYGENQAEAHNTLAENQSPLMNPEHFTTQTSKDDLFFGGVHIDELPKHGISPTEMFPYRPLLRERVDEAGIEVHYFSFYQNWSPMENYYYAMEHSGFSPNLDRSEGTYTKFSSLDDKVDGQHYFTMFIKFGQGRAMNDACRDIRDGFLSREEGVQLVRKFDGEFPGKYFHEVLEYMGITEDRYWEVIDAARSPHLWEQSSGPDRLGRWRLKHQVS